MPTPTERLAELILDKFVSRRDVMAVQNPDGTYRPVESPFTADEVAAHLRKEKTLGHYTLDVDSTCRVITFDCDLRKSGFWIATPSADEVEALDDLAKTEPQVAELAFTTLEEMNRQVVDGNFRELWADLHNGELRTAVKLQMRTLAETLTSRIRSTLEIPTAAAYSGNKGIHVYAFLPEQMAGADARLIANDLLESFGYFAPTRAENFWIDTRTGTDSFSNFEIEVFPKQDEIEEGKFGNLVRLPLGRNHKSKHPAFFIDQSRAHVELARHPDPISLLQTGNPWA